MAGRGSRARSRENVRSILGALIDDGPQSRIELSRSTGIAPSTLTPIIAELVSAGVLEETPQRVATGGRRATPLRICPHQGRIAVIEVTRQWTRLNVYDMGLELVESRELFSGRPSGERIVSAVRAFLPRRPSAGAAPAAPEPAAPRLAGIGVLLGPDVVPSELTYVYSTGFASECISLCDALLTEHRVPVVQEYSQACELRQTYTSHLASAPFQLAPTPGEGLSLVDGADGWRGAAPAGHPLPGGARLSHLDIAIGSRVIAAVVLDGAPLAMSDGPQADVTRLVAEGEGDRVSFRGLTSLISTVSSLFRLQAAFVWATPGSQGLLDRLARWAGSELPEMGFFTRCSARCETRDCSGLVAQTVRRRVLCSDP